MTDILGKELNIGDKVACLPYRTFGEYKLILGIVESFTKNNNACYICPLNTKISPKILKHSNELIIYN